MFPAGLPGLALAMLRASVAFGLLLESFAHRHALPGWAQGAAVLFVLALCVGYLTPIAAALVFVFHCFIWFHFGVGSGTAATVICLDALALGLLGPGAYSMDSWLFGRRVVVLPPP